MGMGEQDLAERQGPPRAVLFDMDGVLLHSYDAWMGLVRAAGRDLAGIEITPEEFASTWGQGVAADVERFFRASTEAEVARYYETHFEEHAGGLRVDPEAAPLLEALRARGVPTAVVTNTPVALARRILAAAGLAPGEVIGADEVPRAKPAPDIVLEACRRLAVAPAAALVVGDSAFDREAAAAAGAAFLGVGQAGGELTAARLGAVLRLFPGAAPGGPAEAAWRRRARRRLAAWVASSAALLLAGFAAGYAVRRAAPPQIEDYEIREGGGHFTNPLLDCEIAGYRRSRELRPFREEIVRTVDGLVARGEAAKVSLYFRDLDNGPWFGIREEETFRPGSLLKVPTIMAALLQAERDPGFLARQVPFHGFRGQGIRGLYQAEQTLREGESYSVEDLLRRAAAYSDNAAVALLNQQVDRQVFARLLKDLGLPPGLADLEAPASLSPRVYGQLFRVLYNGSYLGAEMSERALGYFAQSTFRDGIVAGVPAGTAVAHKFGIFAPPWEHGAGQLHDCGIVYHPGRPYFLCVMTEGGDVDRLAGAIREISGEVYRQIQRQVEEEKPGPLSPEFPVTGSP
jgi:HAD superfamily hydrolase (TIGR01509 family)